MADSVGPPRAVRRASAALFTSGVAAIIGVSLSVVSLALIDRGYPALVTAVEHTPPAGDTAAEIAWTLRSGIHLDLYLLVPLLVLAPLLGVIAKRSWRPARRLALIFAVLAIFSAGIDMLATTFAVPYAGERSPIGAAVDAMLPLWLRTLTTVAGILVVICMAVVLVCLAAIESGDFYRRGRRGPVEAPSLFEQLKVSQKAG